MATQIKSTFAIIIDRVEGQQDRFTIEAKGPNNVQVQRRRFNLSLNAQHQHTLHLLADKPTRVSINEIGALGQALYQALFVPEVAIAFGEARQSLAHSQEGLRIRIQTSIDEIARLPWELMHDGQEFIALRSSYPIVRGKGEPVASLRTDVSGALKILYAWSDPKDLPELRLREPAYQIRDLLSENKRIQFEILENAARDSLSSSLLNDYHILCFAGHGTAEHLYLEKDGGHERISAKELVLELEGKPTRLVFLAACDAGGYTENNLPGFAQTLASQAQVPAVVAMQYGVNDQEANLLTARYLEALAKFRPVDAALTEARKVVYDEVQVVRDVFSPVLYLQSESSRLFRASRNLVAIGLGLLALVAVLALAAQSLFFTDTAQIAAARETAQVEAALRMEAEAETEARQLAARAIDALDTNPGGGLVLAYESARRAMGVSGELTGPPYAALYAALTHPGRPLAMLSWDGPSVDFNPEGTIMAVAGLGGTTQLWDADGQPLASLAGHTDGVLSVAFNPAGTQIITASHDGTARLWGVDGQLIAVLEGHTDSVRSAAFNATGTQIVTASWDGTARLWDVGGQSVKVLAGHTGRVNSAVFSADGMRIITASDDGTARLWDANGEPLVVFEGHTEPVLSALLAPDDTRIVTTSADTTGRLWDVDGRLLAVLEGHTAPVGVVAFSANGTRILTASDDGTARLWDADGRLLAVLEGHTDVIRSAAFNAAGTQIVTASADTTARVWDVDGQLLAVLKGHGKMVWDATFDPAGSRIVTTSLDGTTQLWEAPLASAVLEGHTDSVRAVAFSADGTRMATASNDATARVWTADGWPRAVLEGHTAAVLSVAFSPDGTQLVTGSADTTARLWSADGRALVVMEGHPFDVNLVAFNPDGTRILTASTDTVRLWDTNGALLAVLDPREDLRGGPVTSMAFNTAGTRILIVDGGVHLWNEDGRLLYSLMEAGAMAAAFNAAGTQVITVSADGVRVWSVDGQLLDAQMSGLDDQFLAAFTDSRYIVSVSLDGPTRLWQMDGRTTILEGHTDRVWSAAFNAMGTQVLTASWDGTARLWDDRGQPLIVLAGHTGGWVHSAIFSPDGTQVLTAGADGTARLWRIYPDAESMLTEAEQTLIDLYYPYYQACVRDWGAECEARCIDGWGVETCKLFAKR